MITAAPMISTRSCFHPKPPGCLPRPNGSANSEMRTRSAPSPITTHASIGLSMVALLRRSLDHLIRPLQERRRDRQAEGLGGLEVDHQLELGGLLHREIGGLGALEDLVYVDGGASVYFSHVCSVGHQASSLHRLPP